MLLSVDLAPALHRNSAWNSYFGTMRWLPPGASRLPSFYSSTAEDFA